MASRNGYTITPSYAGNQRQTQPRTTQNQGALPGDPRRPSSITSQKNTKNTNDTFLLTMLFIVAPVCGLLGLPFSMFRWVFIALSAFLIITMWVTKRFMFQGRAFLSGVLVVAAVVSLIAAVDAKSTPQPNIYTPYSAGDPALGALGSSLSAGGQGQNAMPTSPIDTLQAADTQDADSQVGGQIILDAQPTNAPERVMHEAEISLNNYLVMWMNEDFEGMVQYTLPSWRNAQRVPPRQLSYQHNNYTLNSFEIINENLATVIDSATYTVIVNVTKKNSSRETRYGKYSAIVFNNDGMWYVDPDSMRMLLPYDPVPTQAANAGDSGVDMQQDAAPTPEPTADPKMKLYYNSDGGKFYHTDAQCPSLDPKYYNKMKSFAYSDLSKSGYSKLLPCGKCNAPKK